MGKNGGKQLNRKALYPVPSNIIERDVNLVLSRWQIGHRISPDLKEKTKEALLILKEVEDAAELDRKYTKGRYPENTNRAKMRDAELVRSECMLHAVEVTRLLIAKAFEHDDPNALLPAVETARVIKRHILERGFFKLDMPKNPATPSPIKKTEIDAETVEGLALGLRQRIERTYNLFVYAPLSEQCKDMGILLCPFEQLADGTPMPPTLTISKA